MGADLGCALVVERVMERPWSTLYFLHAEDGRRLVTKVHRLPAQSSAADSWESGDLKVRTARELRALERLSEHFAKCPDRRLGVVVPVRRVTALNAVTTEFVDGEPLTASLRSPVRLLHGDARRRADDAVVLAGRWLRWMHTIEPSPDGGAPPVGGPPVGSCAEALGYSRDVLAAIRGWRSLCTTWEALEGADDGEPVVLHGDFQPANVLITAEGVVCFDTALATAGNPGADLGHFLASLRVGALARAARGGVPGLLAFPRWRQLLLEGYGAPIDPRALAVFELASLSAWYRRNCQAAGDNGARRSVLRYAITALAHDWRHTTTRELRRPPATG